MASPPRQRKSALPASSAWTRLVQVTKRASQTSQLDDDAKPSPPPPMRVPETAALISVVDDACARPTLKRRRITGPAMISALARLRASRQAARALGQIAEEDLVEATPENTLSSKGLHKEKEHTDFCPSPKDEADGRCTLAGPGKVENLSRRTLGSGEMRALWEPRRLAEQDRQIRQDPVEEHTAAEHAQEDKGANGGAKDENTLNLFGKRGSRNSVKEVGEMPGQDHVTGGTPQQNIVVVTDKAKIATNGSLPPDVTQTADDPTTSDGVTSTLRGGFKMRRKTNVEKEVNRLEERHEQACQQVNAKLNPNALVDINIAESRPLVPSSSTSSASKPRLRQGTQDTLNRAFNVATLEQQPEVTQLATPASSQSSNSNDENLLSNTAIRKPKRRLTLHDTRPTPKRRKPTPPKKKTAVQTTLALAVGDSAGMRECKVCDTVWNPFHPEDVRVHKKRHAGVVKKERAELVLDVDA